MPSQFHYLAPGRRVNAAGQPRTVPMLAITEATHLCHRMSYCDEHAPHRRSKPDGIAHLELAVLYSASNITDPNDPAVRRERITRTPFTIEHDASTAAQQACYYGRWVSKKGIAGRWSNATAMTVVAVQGSNS